MQSWTPLACKKHVASYLLLQNGHGHFETVLAALPAAGSGLGKSYVSRAFLLWPRTCTALFVNLTKVGQQLPSQGVSRGCSPAFTCHFVY